MQFPHILLVAALGGLIAVPAFSDTQTVEITVKNTGATALSCQAAMAHWYSVSLGDVAPGNSLSFALGADIDSGTAFLRNTNGDEMPVQRLWCGLKGKDWATRFEIPLERRAGVALQDMTLTCTDQDGQTECSAP